MKLIKNLSTMISVMILATAAVAGNERGGGSPPVPIFVREDITYKCDFMLMQLGTSLNIVRPIVSRSSQSFSWKKDSYAGRRGIDLKDVTGWTHAEQTPYGPFGRAIDIEIPSAPVGAIFSGFIALVPDHSASVTPGEQDSLDMVLEVHVASNAINKDIFNSANAENQVSIRSRSNVRAEARLRAENTAGDYLDQRRLSATCSRVQ